MSTAKSVHDFHIPVMGIGYTIDSPIKVAHLGISSVISMVDDLLVEKMRKFYSQKFDEPFQEISTKIEDFRAKRITAYLNLVDKIVKQKVEDVKSSVFQKGSELEKFVDLLPDTSEIKERFNHFLTHNNLSDGIKWLKENVVPGSIDINIMTKLDRENYLDGEKLPIEYNDAHAALRGFAESNLESSVVLSAGMHPRLYSYIESFSDFFPTSTGELKKKIILKVSDYRSAAIQGQFLAKKGIWVSEYRVESGLNCGGHAFATQGYLMGPILEEFKVNRERLIQSTHDVYIKALESKGMFAPEKPFEVCFTAQGGVGTHAEHEFLKAYYNLDSIGWGTAFMVVPEAVAIDDKTLDQLADSKEEDLYLSSRSPLGFLFNTVRKSSMILQQEESVKDGNPGRFCTKGHGAVDYEFSDKVMCLASKKYQKLKIDQLKAKNLSPAEYEKAFQFIVEKECICVGLGTSALLANDVDHKLEGEEISVCPGPNMAYFSKKASLKEMVDHVYGRTNLIERTDRPNLFVNELKIYVDYLEGKITEEKSAWLPKDYKYYAKYRKNLNSGIEYYLSLFSDGSNGFTSDDVVRLDKLSERLNALDLN